MLVAGESGTGKELVARAIHCGEPARAAGRFVAVTARRVPETLLETELFGHEKGAFTGADRRRERPASSWPTAARCSSTRWASCRSATQAKLLRVLQERAVRARWAATAVDPGRRARRGRHQPRPAPAMVEEGRFREDLYYRLNVVPHPLPAAARAPEDILLLAEHFVRELRRRARASTSTGFDDDGAAAGSCAYAGRATCASSRT